MLSSSGSVGVRAQLCTTCGGVAEHISSVVWSASSWLFGSGRGSPASAGLGLSPLLPLLSALALRNRRQSLDLFGCLGHLSAGMRDYLTHTGQGLDIGNTRTGRSCSACRVMGEVCDSLPGPPMLVTEGSGALLSSGAALTPLPA